jgi:hypothetical protein
MPTSVNLCALYNRKMMSGRMKKTSAPSEQTKQEAMQIAKATQKPGQTKEQTKLVAQGIEKGIALYKKQQKEKQRQADKEKKKRLKEQQTLPTQTPLEKNPPGRTRKKQ